MSKTVQLPSEFIALPIIQDNFQDQICDHCETFILGQSKCSIHFMCEGSYCQQAMESFISDNEHVDYPVDYYPSKEVQDLEKALDMRITNLDYKILLQMDYLYEKSDIFLFRLERYKKGINNL